jgi:hypothetical protein
MEEGDARLRASLKALEPWKTVAERLPGRTEDAAARSLH